MATRNLRKNWDCQDWNRDCPDLLKPARVLKKSPGVLRRLAVTLNSVFKKFEFTQTKRTRCDTSSFLSRVKFVLQKQDDQLEHTYSSSARVRDVDLKTCQTRWTIARSGERGSGISVLAARHDDNDDESLSEFRVFLFLDWFPNQGWRIQSALLINHRRKKKVVDSCLY